MPEKKYSKEIENLFNEVKKSLNLRKTEFILDPDIDDSYCRYNPEDEITRCYIKDPITVVYQGVRAFFKERDKRFWRELETAQYLSKIKNIQTDSSLEEVTARIIDANFQNITLGTCPDNIQKYVTFFSETARWHEDRALGEKIVRLYISISKNNCICPKDVELYNNIKKDIDPIIVYNKLAKYVGTHELI